MSVLKGLTRLLDPLTKIQWGIKRDLTSAEFNYKMQAADIATYIIAQRNHKRCRSILIKHGINPDVVLNKPLE